MLDSKGQEFSVFKLLISAIVAIVILTILLQIIGIIQFPGVGDPKDAAKTMIKNIDANPYSEDISKNVVFKTGTSLTAAGLAEVSGGLAEEQICLDVGRMFEDRGGWDESTEKRIYYKGSADQRARLAGICVSYDKINDLSDSEKSSAPQLTNVWANPSCSTCDESLGRCCFIALISQET